jgi:hypothetical protein
MGTQAMDSLVGSRADCKTAKVTKFYEQKFANLAESFQLSAFRRFLG